MKKLSKLIKKIGLKDDVVLRNMPIIVAFCDNELTFGPEQNVDEMYLQRRFVDFMGWTEDDRRTRKAGLTVEKDPRRELILRLLRRYLCEFKSVSLCLSELGPVDGLYFDGVCLKENKNEN